MMSPKLKINKEDCRRLNSLPAAKIRRRAARSGGGAVATSPSRRRTGPGLASSVAVALVLHASGTVAIPYAAASVSAPTVAKEAAGVVPGENRLGRLEVLPEESSSPTPPPLERHSLLDYLGLGLGRRLGPSPPASGAAVRRREDDSLWDGQNDDTFGYGGGSGGGGRDSGAGYGGYGDSSGGSSYGGGSTGGTSGGSSTYGGYGDTSGGGGASTGTYGSYGDSSGGAASGSTYGSSSGGYGDSSTGYGDSSTGSGSSSSYGGYGSSTGSSSSSYGGYGSSSSSSSSGYGGYGSSSGYGSYGSSSSYTSPGSRGGGTSKLGRLLQVKVPLVVVLLLFPCLLFAGMTYTAHAFENRPESTYANFCRLVLHTARCVFRLAYNLYHCRLGEIPAVVCALDDEDEYGREYTDEELDRMKLRPGIGRALDVEHRKALKRTRETELKGGNKKKGGKGGGSGGKDGKKAGGAKVGGGGAGNKKNGAAEVGGKKKGPYGQVPTTELV